MTSQITYHTQVVPRPWGSAWSGFESSSTTNLRGLRASCSTSVGLSFLVRKNGIIILTPRTIVGMKLNEIKCLELLAHAYHMTNIY